MTWVRLVGVLWHDPMVLAVGIDAILFRRTFVRVFDTLLGPFVQRSFSFCPWLSELAPMLLSFYGVLHVALLLLGPILPILPRSQRPLLACFLAEHLILPLVDTVCPGLRLSNEQWVRRPLARGIPGLLRLFLGS